MAKAQVSQGMTKGENKSQVLHENVAAKKNAFDQMHQQAANAQGARAFNGEAQKGNASRMTGKELSLDADERILQLEGMLANEALTTDQRADIENQLKVARTAKLGTKTDEDDKSKETKEGEKFSKGDIIDYLYDQFLKLLSLGFDNLDAFLLAAGEKTGKFLGEGIRNIIDGGKKLANNIKEQQLDRDYKNAARAIDNMYEKEVSFHQARRDFAIKNMKEAALLGTIMTKGSSLEAVDAQYNELKEKKNLSDSEKQALKVLETIRPKDKSVPAERKVQYKMNLQKTAERYGPVLFDAVMPREGESQKDFRIRFNFESVEKINTSIANCVDLCEVQKGAVYAAKLQALAECSAKLNPKMSADEKNAVVLGCYVDSSKDIDGHLKESFGDVVKNGLSDEDKKRCDDFLAQRNAKSTDIIKKNAKCLDEKHNLDARKDELATELGELHAIGVPEVSKGREKNEKKKEGLEGLAESYNTLSPTEKSYQAVTEKIQRNEQKKKESEARKARRASRANRDVERVGSVGMTVNTTINNKTRE